MVGSITVSTTIVFPFVIAFMRILNLPVGIGESRGDVDSNTTKDTQY
jgi:hypothetical protein